MVLMFLINIGFVSFYFHNKFIFVKCFISVTIMTLVNSDSGFWEREDGTPFNFWAILTAGWVGFFMSILLNVVLYKVHPSGVPFSLSHPKKMVVHVFGKEYKLRKTPEGNARICFPILHKSELLREKLRSSVFLLESTILTKKVQI